MKIKDHRGNKEIRAKRHCLFQPDKKSKRVSGRLLSFQPFTFSYISRPPKIFFFYLSFILLFFFLCHCLYTFYLAFCPLACPPQISYCPLFFLLLSFVPRDKMQQENFEKKILTSAESSISSLNILSKIFITYQKDYSSCCAI